ncbi:PTS sugar transporter subunit IIA [Ideonella oryzae]|uniref:PTS fructose transporter subunit IIA n=1 Tax=Ideonella oryzae TaxID=2937441 RepID=A0ABT1BMY3_9BURK|nr:PTS fructose transporter subunit IIA [Ideonella oryzae]MCO5977488.1 PTS fructose transporter subunit IIA [Ideonella oryzae]
MPGLLIVAHTPLASALRAVAGHVFPERLDRVSALDVAPDEPVEQVEVRVRESLAGMSGHPVLVLTDVFGATPSNVVQRLTDGVEVRLVTGVNVPMLWRLLSHLDESLESLVGRAVAGGSQGVMQIASQRPQNQALNLLTHDQSHAHHQQ